MPRHAELVSASIHQLRPLVREAKWTLKHVQGDGVFYPNTPATQTRRRRASTSAIAA